MLEHQYLKRIKRTIVIASKKQQQQQQNNTAVSTKGNKKQHPAPKINIRARNPQNDINLTQKSTA